jgi:hypothetical protein
MLNLLVAHHAEAVPFIERYGLTRVADSNPVKYLKNGSVRLLITGQGKDRCRAALLGFIEQVPHSDQDRWLNFGVAGSSQFSLGSLVRGASLMGSEGAALALMDWPTQEGDQRLPDSVIRTAKQPERMYKQDGVFDMEAAELYALLGQHNCHERFWALKLVTDGPTQPVDKSTRRATIDLINIKASAITSQSDIFLQTV